MAEENMAEENMAEENQTKVKKNGKALTGILCFIFGFIFAVIVAVAAVAVSAYCLLKSDVDDMLSTVGVENTDEDGNKIYINTDLEDLTTVSDLISVIKTLASDFDINTTTLGDLDEYFPVVEATIDKLYDLVTDLITDYLTEEEFKELLYKDELMNIPIAEIPNYIYDCIENSTLNDLNFDVYTDETLFLYVVYGITDIQVKDGVWTATYHFLEDEESDIDTCTVTVVVDESSVNDNGGYLVSKVYYITDDGEEVKVGTKKNQETRQRLDGLFEYLTIGDFIYDIIGSTMLSDLCDMGVLEVEKEYLEKEITYNGETLALGELTLSEYISYTLTLIP